MFRTRNSSHRKKISTTATASHSANQSRHRVYRQWRANDDSAVVADVSSTSRGRLRRRITLDNLRSFELHRNKTAVRRQLFSNPFQLQFIPQTHPMPRIIMYAWGAEGNVIEITSPSLELHNVNTEWGLFVSYASMCHITSANQHKFCLQCVDVVDHRRVWSAGRNQRYVTLSGCRRRYTFQCL